MGPMKVGQGLDDASGVALASTEHVSFPACRKVLEGLQIAFQQK